jgi:serine/threonine protein kinase/Flp pilus assembly protein TadD
MNKIELAPTSAAEDQQLVELVEEITARLQAGQPCDIDAYAARYPEYADRLRDWMTVMSAMADLGHSLATSQRSGATAESVLRGSPDPADPASNIQYPAHVLRGSPDPAQFGLLGDFRIVREIGRGGMGVVYEAEQLSIGRRVALKVLPFAAMLDRQQLNRFKNEARAAGTLDHPNIVAVHAVGVERGVHYYAMQLIEGQSLAQIVEQIRIAECGLRIEKNDSATPASQSAIRNPQSEIDTAPIAHLTTLPDFNSKEYYRSVAKLGIQAAEALDHAHQNGILHRDIKPANLLVECDGAGGAPNIQHRASSIQHLKLWITDFGLARMEADAGMTMTGDILGTLRYMSPEQALAKRVVVDHRSDIYSLGVTLYELLTLQPAFTGDDRQELLRQIAFEDPRMPRQINSRIPQDLETIVSKSIEKNPAQRYATAHEMAHDLRSFLDSQPIKAKPPSWRDRIVKWSSRHPAGVRATLLALLATAGVITASIGWAVRDRAARQSLLEEQVTLALDEANTWYEAGKLPEAISAVKRAEGLLATGDVSNNSKLSVAQRRSDFETVERLDKARFDRAAHRGAQGEASSIDQIYEGIFIKYGIELQKLDIKESALRIRNAPIKDKLVAALDDWFLARAADDTENADRKLVSGRPELLQIARLADPNSWRNRLRDAVELGDEAALVNLAKDKEVTEQPPATITLLAKALVARRKQVPAAIELLKQAQWRHPNDFWINIELANCLRFVHPQRTEEAIVFRHVAVALRPDIFMAYNHLATALAADGQFREAEIAQQKAVSLAPNTIGSLAFRAQELDRQGKRSEAEALLRELMQLKPVTTYEHGTMAGMLLHFGKRAEAEAIIRDSIRLAPNHYQARQSLGEMLQAQGKYAEAETAFREAIRIRPDVLALRCSLVEALRLQGKLDDAKAELHELLQLKPSGHGEYYGLATVLLRLKRTDEAEKALRESIAQAPEFLPAINELAWLLATMPRDELRNGRESVELARRACELSEYKQAGLIDTLAAAHAEAGDFESAIKWSQNAVDLAADDATRAEFTTHLESFKAKRPWRESPAANEPVPEASAPLQNPKPTSN